MPAKAALLSTLSWDETSALIRCWWTLFNAECRFAAKYFCRKWSQHSLGRNNCGLSRNFVLFLSAPPLHWRWSVMTGNGSCEYALCESGTQPNKTSSTVTFAQKRNICRHTGYLDRNSLAKKINFAKNLQSLVVQWCLFKSSETIFEFFELGSVRYWIILISTENKNQKTVRLKSHDCHNGI